MLHVFKHSPRSLDISETCSVASETAEVVFPSAAPLTSSGSHTTSSAAEILSRKKHQKSQNKIVVLLKKQEIQFEFQLKYRR